VPALHSEWTLFAGESEPSRQVCLRGLPFLAFPAGVATLRYVHEVYFLLKKITFTEAIKEIRKAKTASMIEFVYEQVTMDIPLKMIKDGFNVV
jgi:hypothetical protein